MMELKLFRDRQMRGVKRDREQLIVGQLQGVSLFSDAILDGGADFALTCGQIFLMTVIYELFYAATVC